MDTTEITIIGAGVVGLAIAAELASLGKEIIVVERHDRFGRETSSRNSEVIHAGIYYPKDSLRARLCVEGRRLLYEICAAAGIPHKKVGKLIIAVEEGHLPILEKLKKKGEGNAVEGLRLISRDEVLRLEPHIAARGGLLSPETGIIDSHRLMAHFEHRASAAATFAYNCSVVSLRKTGEGYQVGIRDADGGSYDFISRVVINAAGLGAETVAKLSGIDTAAARYVIHPCQGEYFRVSGAGKKVPRRLVYPPPTEISLGLHTVIDLGGGMKIGPNAFYVDEINYDVDESHRSEFFRQARGYLPWLKEEDLVPDMSGIRPKLFRKGEPERDFVIREESDRGLPGLITLIGIESPGLTAAPAIARSVAGLAKELI
jgi:L-2-hydroxyglutarate oxidase LhgO